MVSSSFFPQRSLRYAVVVGFAALFALALLVAMPRLVEGRKEQPFFYSQALSPIVPQEVILVKASGETLGYSHSTVPKIEDRLLGQVLATPIHRDPREASVSKSLPGTGSSYSRYHSPFRVTNALRPTVDFWKKVFATYGRSQVLMHHRDRLDVVFSVLDFQGLETAEEGLGKGEIARLREKLIDLERESILADQGRARASAPSFTFDRHELVRNPGLVRAQTGIREHFADAIRWSGRYMPYIEQILVDANVPVEISRLPFIESSFDVTATSSAGAAGIWQFMESTAKLYHMKVNRDIDERRDPLSSTYAAAQFFKNMIRDLGTWPLAVNGYNTGHGRILQAMKQLGSSDIETIIRDFKHPAYQFASRNFYPEFLAALEVYEARSQYFPDLTPMAAIEYDLFSPPASVSLPVLAKSCDVSIEELKILNPGLAGHFFTGEKPIRSDLQIKVPYLKASEFEYAFARFERVGDRYSLSRQLPPNSTAVPLGEVETLPGMGGGAVGAGLVGGGALND